MKKVTEGGVWSELERVCRIIAVQKVDDNDIVMMRNLIGGGLSQIDTIRAEKQRKAERRAEMAALTKKVTAIDKEIERVGRYGQGAMAEKLREEREKIQEQIRRLK